MTIRFHKQSESKDTLLLVQGPVALWNNAVHTPKVYNKLGSAGGLYSGTPSCASCYYSFSNTQQIVGVPGVVYVTGTDSEMWCNLMNGAFYDGGVSNGKVIYSYWVKLLSELSKHEYSYADRELG